MFKVRIIRLLTMVLAIGTLVSPSYSAQASTPLGNVFFSQTVGDGTNFLFSDITVTKTNYLAQSESVTVTGLLKTDPGGVQTPLASATVTISLQKVDPTNSNASVGAPISVTTILVWMEHLPNHLPLQHPVSTSSPWQQQMDQLQRL
jgi:hypothetical protein